MATPTLEVTRSIVRPVVTYVLLVLLAIYTLRVLIWPPPLELVDYYYRVGQGLFVLNMITTSMWFADRAAQRGLSEMIRAWRGHHQPND